MTQTTFSTRNRFLWGLALTAAILASPISVSAQETFEISIQVSPNTLNLRSEGEVVTVHTDVPYVTVNGQLVTLNGVVISTWKADDRGDFVAKFLTEDIKGLDLEIGALNTLTLQGWTNDEPPQEFYGITQVRVIDRGKF